MDFDLQFYTLLIQLCGKLDVEKDANAFLDMILNVTEHSCKLLSAIQPKIDEIEIEEDAEMQEENKELTEEEKKKKEEEKQKKLDEFRDKKRIFVRLKVTILSIVIASLQLLLMIVIYVSKFKSQKIRQTMEEENKWNMEEDGEEKKEGQKEKAKEIEKKVCMEIANSWFQTVNPQKVLHVSMKLFEQVNTLIAKATAIRNKDGPFLAIGMIRKEFDLMELMQCVSDCSILVASQTLSLGHWNYAMP